MALPWVVRVGSLIGLSIVLVIAPEACARVPAANPAPVAAPVPVKFIGRRCVVPTTIGAFAQSFDAPARVLDRARLVARIPTEHASEVRVGMTVGVPDTLAETGIRAWVIRVDGPDATATLDPPPEVYAVSPTQPAIMRLGASGVVQMFTVSLGKTGIMPAAALRPVPGRPGVATVLIRHDDVEERRAVRVEYVVGRGALIGAVDPSTAAALGVTAAPPDFPSTYVVPDDICRADGVGPTEPNGDALDLRHLGGF